MSLIGQRDRTIHEQLPAVEDWPQLLLPEHLSGRFPLNCFDMLLGRHVENGFGDRVALRSENRTYSYREVYQRSCQLAALLEQDYGVVSGQRVLLRGSNSPDLVVCWLGIQLLGAIPVTTLSMLRAGELSAIIIKSSPTLCLCEQSLLQELRDAINLIVVAGKTGPGILEYDNGSGEFENRVSAFPSARTAYPTASDDIALIGFTSGTTGSPKATVHFHRDVISSCEIIADRVIGAGRDDVFIGTAPLAFTFGLGGLLLFPLYSGASSVLSPRYSPEQLMAGIAQHQGTICFTVPTFYQRMARLKQAPQLSSLRLAICSGEALPLRIRETWFARTGINLSEFFGSTEMLHAFIGGIGAPVVPGSIGCAFPGYEATILDNLGRKKAAGEIGRLGVRGPTGCRYLDDSRQTEYVQRAWNITGDICSMDSDGNVTYHTRADDMIITSGYNVAGIEVENALLTHPAVAECAVIGEGDDERGVIIKAFLVLRHGTAGSPALVEVLQRHVKNELAPYKYPRKVCFVPSLPRNESGKIQRFRLHDADRGQPA